jgi:hypothetical protein
VKFELGFRTAVAGGGWGVRMVVEMQYADGLRLATMRRFEKRRWLGWAGGWEDDFKLHQTSPEGEI